VLEQGVWAAPRVRVLRREYCGAHVPWRALTWPGTGVLRHSLCHSLCLPLPARTHQLHTVTPAVHVLTRLARSPRLIAADVVDPRQWTSTMIKAHKIGVNAVSWAPACSGMRLVTAGCDNLVKIWNCDESGNTWAEEATLGRADERHTDWVRDVAWAPTVDGAAEMIASCSQDKKVIIWTAGRSGEWVPKTIQMSWCATRRSNRRAHRSLHACVRVRPHLHPPARLGPPPSSRPTRRRKLRFACASLCAARCGR
jgi:WD40 repeat protein